MSTSKKMKSPPRASKIDADTALMDALAVGETTSWRLLELAERATDETLAWAAESLAGDDADDPCVFGVFDLLVRQMKTGESLAALHARLEGMEWEGLDLSAHKSIVMERMRMRRCGT